MSASPLGRRKLPYSYNMLWVSLAVALLVLVPVFVLNHLGILTTAATIWITLGVVCAAALYESSLLYVLTRHMFRKIGRRPDDAGRKRP